MNVPAIPPTTNTALIQPRVPVDSPYTSLRNAWYRLKNGVRPRPRIIAPMNTRRVVRMDHTVRHASANEGGSSSCAATSSVAPSCLRSNQPRTGSRSSAKPMTASTVMGMPTATNIHRSPIVVIATAAMTGPSTAPRLTAIDDRPNARPRASGG
jgi:hypothetical protein